MSPMQGRIRKTFNLLKDQGSIYIAKVSAGLPKLKVAILKATSHEEAPSDERYVGEVICRASYARASVDDCVCSIAKRLSKTHSSAVAIKALILAHRLLCAGDPKFEKNLRRSRRRGTYALDVSNFRDECHQNGMDISTFVHAYGLYLDSRLECSSFESFELSLREVSLKGSKYNNSDGTHGQDNHALACTNSEMRHLVKEQSRFFNNIEPAELIDVVPSFQCLMGSVLACKPLVSVKENRLVNEALDIVIRESFVVYEYLQVGLNILHDSFFDMDLDNRSQVLDIYTRAAKQMEVLTNFYSFCKESGICETAHYPRVQAISKKKLLKMECLMGEEIATEEAVAHYL